MRERFGMVVAGVALHVLLYGASIPFLFSWDDRKIVIDCPEVNGQAPLASTLTRPWVYEESARGVNYRPVTVLSLGLDVRLFGFRPEPLRSENILLAGVGAGLFGLLVRSLGASPFVGWWSVVLLSCHPVRSEPVISIVGRSEVLAFLFLVGALLARRRPLLSAFLLLLALLSKENAFVAPALLVLLFAFEGRATGGGIPLSFEDGQALARRLRQLVLAWGGAYVVAFAARFAVLGGLLTGTAARVNPSDNLLAALSPVSRLLGAISLFPLAVARLLWPTTLSPDYSKSTFLVDDLLSPSAVAWGAAVLGSAVALAAALLFVASLRKRAPLVGFGLAWALVAYIPFANFLFPTGIVFTERILFLPAAGVVVAAAAAGDALRESDGSRPAWRLSAVLVGILLVLLGGARIIRLLPDWRDDRTLMEAIARDLPTNSKAFWNLAILSLGEGKTEEACRHLTRALALDPNDRVHAEELVRHAEQLGKRDQVEALTAVIRAAQGRPPVR